MNITAIVLTGGKSQRMGKNKLLEVVAGKRLIDRVYERIEPISSEIIIVTSTEFNAVPVRDGMKIVTDIYPEKGPLGGIFTGLSHSDNEINIVVGGDMPFLNTGLLAHMAELSTGFEAVVPLMGENMIEPLHAVYSKSCAGKIEERLKINELKIYTLINTLNVRYIEKDVILEYDPELTTFFNVTYPSDLDRAEVLAEKNDNNDS